jgi:hypothetical protein
VVYSRGLTNGPGRRSRAHSKAHAELFVALRADFLDIADEQIKLLDITANIFRGSSGMYPAAQRQCP